MPTPKLRSLTIVKRRRRHLPRRTRPHEHVFQEAAQALRPRPVDLLQVLLPRQDGRSGAGK